MTAPSTPLVEYTARKLAPEITGFSFDDLLEEQQAELCQDVKETLDACHAEEMQAMLGHVLERHRLPSGDSPADLSGTLDQVEALLGKLEMQP